MTGTKIRSRNEAVRWRADAGKCVVFTNGVFDLLHPGHIALLEQARVLGNALVVGVNSDASAARLGKGAGRPLVPGADRACVLAALAAVDCVVIFEEDTPATLIEALIPDVLVKGADYTADAVPGREVVLARGGEVSVIALREGYSTSALVERIHATT